MRDHPHAYGDKKNDKKRGLGSEGSSPRVWGQVLYIRILPNITRIIPTRVGTRYPSMMHSESGKDHPHACGDKYGYISALLVFLGSSPRVWGQEAIGLSVPERRRIIPTRVGTSYAVGERNNC